MRTSYLLTTLVTLCFACTIAGQPVSPLPPVIFSKAGQDLRQTLYVPGKDQLLVIGNQKAWFYSRKGELVRGPYTLREDGGDPWFPRVSETGRYISFYKPGKSFFSANDRMVLYDTDSALVRGTYTMTMSSEITRSGFSGDSLMIFHSTFLHYQAVSVWRTGDNRMKNLSLESDSTTVGVYDVGHYGEKIMGVLRNADTLFFFASVGSNEPIGHTIALRDSTVKNYVQLAKDYPYILVGDEDRNDTRIFLTSDTSFSEVARIPLLPEIFAVAGDASACYVIYRDSTAGNRFSLYNSTTKEATTLPFPSSASDHLFDIYPAQKIFTVSHPSDGSIRAYSLATGQPVWNAAPQLPLAVETVTAATASDNSLFRVLIKQGSDNVSATWFDPAANHLLLLKNRDKLVTVDADSKCAVRFEQFYTGKGNVTEVRMVPGNRYLLYMEEKWQRDPDNKDEPDWRRTLYQYPYVWRVFDRTTAKNILEIKSTESVSMYVINDTLVAWARGGFLDEGDSLAIHNLASGATSFTRLLPWQAINGIKVQIIDNRTYYIASTIDNELMVINDKGKKIFQSVKTDDNGGPDEAFFVPQSPYFYFIREGAARHTRLYKVGIDTVSIVRAFPPDVTILAAKATTSGCHFLYRREFERKKGKVNHFRIVEMITGKDRLIDSSYAGLGITPVYELFPDDNYYISYDYKITSWHDLQTGYVYKEFGRDEPTIVSLVYSPDGRYLAAANPSGKVMLWDLGTGKETKTLSVGKEGYITRLAFSGDGKYLAASSGDIWETATGKNVVSVTDGTIWQVNSIDFSNDGQRIISGGACIISWDASDGSKLVYQQEPGQEDMKKEDCWNPNGCVDPEYNFMVHSTAFHPNSRDFVTGNKGGIIQKWNTETRKMSAYKVLEYVTGQPERKVTDLRYTRDGKYVIAVQRRMLYRLDGNTLEVLDSLLLPENEEVLAIDMGYANDQFGCITSRLNARLVQVRSLTSLNVQKEFRTEGANFNKLSFSPNGKQAATSSEDGFCTIWDLSSGNPVLYLSTIGEYGNIMVTRDNFYMASKSALDGVTFFRNGNFYSFDQFDLYLNRPDIVLERLGYASPELVNFYRNAYFKRLKKTTGNIQDTIPSTVIPDLVLTNKKSISPVTRDSSLVLNLSITDSIAEKGTLRISINGNLVSERKVHNMNRQGVTVADSVLLGQGVNNIEAVYRSASGMESHKQKASVTYNPIKKITPKTWFIGIGVSGYSDKKMNLKYPVKDVRDLARAFKKKYPGIIIDTLLDGKATKENIIALREKLLKTSVNDRVIVSFNGHGLLSDSLDWYFGTYDVDPAKPAIRGLAYADMEYILQGIPARQKLLLLDACHSGEVDRESDITFANRTTDMEKAVVATTRGIIIKNKASVGLQTSFELMQEMFANLNNGNGTTVLSAAGGMEYALESDTWKNGVFTYSMLKALRDPATDENGDKKISVKELKKAVFSAVKTLTGGRQKPTSRVEVLDDWDIW